jgi:hypothetical protein
LEIENRNAAEAIKLHGDETARAVTLENWAKTLVTALDSATRTDLTEFSTPGSVGMAHANFQEQFTYRNEGPHFIVEASSLIAFLPGGDVPVPGDLIYGSSGAHVRPLGFVLEIGLRRRDIAWEVWTCVAYSLNKTTKRDFDIDADSIWSAIEDAAKILGTQYAKERIELARAA